MAAWYIKTRKEFFDVLDATIADVARRNAETPEFPPFGSVLRQLEAMKKWTDGGRRPTAEEQRKISIGLIAVRELDAELDDDIAALYEKLVQLDGYFSEWPDDPPGGP